MMRFARSLRVRKTLIEKFLLRNTYEGKFVKIEMPLDLPLTGRSILFYIKEDENVIHWRIFQHLQGINKDTALL